MPGFFFTPREIQAAGLVKEGKTTKEIAELLVSTTDVIDFHRKNLRKKLDLKKSQQPAVKRLVWIYCYIKPLDF
ncbi:MAG: helix-turn-helix transcriptional regulator [Desulfobacterales bacterium]|uniref:Helix-turn-helix transcriptional regulator n=1 Tax=Candidatus Desulfatibia vada TaxID=2841696 RepID=A0A8J6NV43_9BACT|nr:helix-turn-helix transcriptional regulator [Candidatus Desulfatibia vada]MBL7218163.1 helix-turn-helix transcriptional regulator [Desulfobacteraceae bacterium]